MKLHICYDFASQKNSYLVSFCVWLRDEAWLNRIVRPYAKGRGSVLPRPLCIQAEPAD